MVIYTIKPDGGSKPITATRANREPAYSPNGKRIAFAGRRTRLEIYTINAGGGGKKNSQTTTDEKTLTTRLRQEDTYSGIDTPKRL